MIRPLGWSIIVERRESESVGKKKNDLAPRPLPSPLLLTDRLTGLSPNLLLCLGFGSGLQNQRWE